MAAMHVMHIIIRVISPPPTRSKKKVKRTAWVVQGRCRLTTFTSIRHVLQDEMTERMYAQKSVENSTASEEQTMFTVTRRRKPTIGKSF